MNMPNKPSNPARRRLIADNLRSACGIGLATLGLGLHSRTSKAVPSDAVRPPGALSEDDFLSACVRCGLCVRDCPYDTLKLAQLADDVALGTPYFEAREIPCEMCDDIPCVVACPTGALQKKLQDINDARMGLAVLIDQESCIAFHGLRCEVCFNVCPVRGEAITLDYKHNSRSGKHSLIIPTVHSDACTGCGKCEHACILDEAAIKILPINLAKGELGKHYRLGWIEKQQRGEALVTPDQPHKYNLPEGLDYDHTGEGLIEDKSAPFPNNPLDTLNKKGGF